LGINRIAEKGEDRMTRALEGPERTKCFGISAALSAYLVGAIVALIYVPALKPDGPLWIVGTAALGGLFGGAGRSLIMFISEIGVHANPLSDSRPPEELLSRWALYLAKPFAGVASGVLFFFAVKYGLVSAFTNEADENPLSVFFIAAIGGVMFEEAIRLSERLTGRHTEPCASNSPKQKQAETEK
jgi:hypothetical protein